MSDKNDNEIVTRGDRERASNRLWRLIFWVFLIVLATIALSMENAEAAGLRCDNNLVRPGAGGDGPGRFARRLANRLRYGFGRHEVARRDE